MLELYTKLQARLAQEDGQTMAEYGSFWRLSPSASSLPSAR
jgi:hypothetical protein